VLPASASASGSSSIRECGIAHAGRRGTGVGLESVESPDRHDPGAFDQVCICRANYPEQATDLDVHRINDRRGRHHRDAAGSRHTGSVNDHSHRTVDFVADALDGLVAAVVSDARNDFLLGSFG